MSFTYALPFNDTSRVRFHTGDTTEATAALSDELIAALITEYGSWQQATIQALDYLITQLNTPNFKADWLQVDSTEAIATFERLLARKRQEFGIGLITGAVGYTYRADSAQTEESDYTDGRPGSVADDTALTW